MKKRYLTLVKAILVNGKETLPSKFEKWYHAEEDCYVFFSTTSYDTVTGSFDGKLKLHDRLITDLQLPHLTANQFNYVSVDFSRIDSKCTYLSTNSKHRPLTEAQVYLLVHMFDVDMVSTNLKLQPNTF